MKFHFVNGTLSDKIVELTAHAATKHFAPKHKFKQKWQPNCIYFSI